jgi:hypothetical protein
MDALLAGLIGVVGTAVAGGGVTSTLAYLDRGRAARSACRLIYVQLHDAQAAINDLRERRDWGQMITDWDSYDRSWDKYSDDIVQVLDTTDSATLATAFACLNSLARSKAHHVIGASFDPPDALLHLYARVVNRARLLALGASFTKREREKRDEAVTLAEVELPIAPLAEGISELPMAPLAGGIAAHAPAPGK